MQTKNNFDFEHSAEDLVDFLRFSEEWLTHPQALAEFFRREFEPAMWQAVDHLREYCKVKYSAMIARERGLIPAARQLEDLADIEFNKLPVYARW